MGAVGASTFMRRYALDDECIALAAAHSIFAGAILELCAAIEAVCFELPQCFDGRVVGHGSRPFWGKVRELPDRGDPGRVK